MKKIPVPPLILASSSPRRQQLLREVGVCFEVVAPLSEEVVKNGESPAKMVQRLALEKALSVAGQLQNESRIVLAADTSVTDMKNKRLLGKPRSVAEAAKMLRLLSGRSHRVYTGYCMVSLKRGRRARIHQRVVGTRVEIRPLTERLIRSYIACGESMDKAGAYAAQGFGMGLVKAIHGSYTNVVGLPICEVLEDLNRLFGVPIFHAN